MGDSQEQNKKLPIYIEFWDEQVEEIISQYLEDKGYTISSVELGDANGLPVVRAEIYGFLDKE